MPQIFQLIPDPYFLVGYQQFQRTARHLIVSPIGRYRLFDILKILLRRQKPRLHH